MNEKTGLIIVTGLSGAGMSSVLKGLEDLGYEVIDNFPLSLVQPLMAQQESSGKPLAIGIDTRTRGFDPSGLLDTVRRYEARLVFITCDDAVLQKRFTETRRKHPMAKDRQVADGIRSEHELLGPLIENADRIIDTTSLSIHDLRRQIEGFFSLGKTGLTVTVMSFGYKNGLPREADIVMDVRFLRNPHWDEKLKSLTGREKAVKSYIREDPGFDPFINNFKKLLGTALPRYAREGKNYLTIAIGCTGGKHRSVYICEEIAGWLDSRNFKAHIFHRDIPA